jgi:hypothetical protein
VPYTGAKDDVDLGEYFLKASHLKLKTDLATIPTDQGSIYWDEDEETIAVILNGSTTKVGEDIFFQVKNQSGATIPKGTAVRFDGVVGASGRIKIVPFLANGSNPSIYFLGVTYEAIANGADGKALFNGKIRDVNTSAFAVGDILYASPTVAGGFTTTKPIAPNNIISVAAVLSSGNNGILLIRPQIGSNINNDEGVKITTPTTGDILQLQASGLWENKSLSGAGFLSGSGTTNYLAKFTAAGTVGDSQVFDNGTNVLIDTLNNNGAKLQVNGTGTFISPNNVIGSLLIQGGKNVVTTLGEINSKLDFGSNDTSVTEIDGFRVAGRIASVTEISNGAQVGMAFYTYNQDYSLKLKEAIRINSFGNLGVGTISPSARLHILYSSGGITPSNYLQIEGSIADNSNYPGISLKGGTLATTYPSIRLGNGGLALELNSGIASAFNNPTQILLNNGVLTFSTANNASLSERMRITSGGNILINTTTDAGFRLDVDGTGRFSSYVFGANFNSTVARSNTVDVGTVSNNPNYNFIANSGWWGIRTNLSNEFNIDTYFGGSPKQVFNIAQSGAATFSSSVTAIAFFTSSDKRKKDIISQDGDLATYRFKGNDQIHYGYIAQDMQGLYPNQVSTDNDGMMSLNYIEILVKKVHDLEKEIQLFKNK